jgi:hypothetical protein
MKTLLKIMFLLAVTSLITACSRQDEISDENNADLKLKSADTRTIHMIFHPTENEFYCPVICDNETVDFLTGDGESLTVHGQVHLVNGQMTKVVVQCMGRIQSKLTGETFFVNEHDKFIMESDGGWRDMTAHTHLVGDRGTHLLLISYLASDEDFVNGNLVVIKAMCVPNSKNN